MRSPISEYTRAKPFYSGLNMSQKNYYIKMLEEADEKKKLVSHDTNNWSFNLWSVFNHMVFKGGFQCGNLLKVYSQKDFG